MVKFQKFQIHSSGNAVFNAGCKMKTGFENCMTSHRNNLIKLDHSKYTPTGKNIFKDIYRQFPPDKLITRWCIFNFPYKKDRNIVGQGRFI